MEGKIKTNWTVEKLLKENAELKAKLDNVKYFNRQEVEKIFEFIWHNYNKSFKEELITAICNLAIPENICKMKTYKDDKLKS